MGKVEVKVVVGSNYGDEGKGLATHYFSQKANQDNKSCLNILFNGGCQRGHTVELKNGIRHIFHHFGSGSFDNANTYFDQDFMVNPMVFVEEKEKLCAIMKEFGYEFPKCYISPECRVTTPYDMFINQIVETSRANNRHGSCGYGIWETQKRYEDGRYSLKYGELQHKTDYEIIRYLHDIAYKYLPERLASYGVTEIPEEYQNLIDSYGLAKHYLSDLRQMQREVVQISFDKLIPMYDIIVFEGAQGLELDEGNKKALPYITASKTTSFVPIKRIAPYGFDVEICYITRSYFTRHGAGVFPTECQKEEINPCIEDKTNVHNDFQESIRYGKFDLDEFLGRVQKDIDLSKSVIQDATISLLVSHLNYTNDIAGNCTINDLRQYFDNIYTSKTKYSDDIQSSR